MRGSPSKTAGEAGQGMRPGRMQVVMTQRELDAVREMVPLLEFLRRDLTLVPDYEDLQINVDLLGKWIDALASGIVPPEPFYTGVAIWARVSELSNFIEGESFKAAQKATDEAVRTNYKHVHGWIERIRRWLIPIWWEAMREAERAAKEGKNTLSEK